MTDRIFSSLLSRKTLIILLSVFGLVFLASLWNRYIQSDENWIGEQSYWLLKNGVVQIKTMKGILGFENRMFVYHPLLVYAGAALIAVFGWSLPVLKIFVLLLFLLFLFILFRYFRNNCVDPAACFLIATVLVFVNPAMMLHSFMFRPEIAVMTAGFLSFYFLTNALKNNSVRASLLSGLFAGIAFLITYNGLLFPVAGFLLLLVNKKYRMLVSFCAVAVIVAGIATIELWNKEHLDIFLYQFRNWPTHRFGSTYLDKNAGSWLLRKLLNLLNIHQQFFWSDRVFVFSAIFFLSLIASFRKLWADHRNTILYMIFLTLTLNIFGSFIAERYLLYLFPYMAILLVYGIIHIATGSVRWPKIAFMILLLLQVVAITKTSRFVFSMNNNYTKNHSGILSRIPEKDAVILAPWTFIYNGVEDRNLVSYKSIQYYEENLGRKILPEEFLKLVKEKYKADYFIIQTRIMNEADWNHYWFGDHQVILNNPLYEEYYRDDAFIIMKHK